MDYESLIAQLQPYGQEHLVQFWDQLDPLQQQRLAGQIAAVDLNQMKSLYEEEAATSDWEALARRAEPPVAMRLADRSGETQGADGLSPPAARRAGAKALAEGKIGILLVAGGQGSRLGFEHPKGMFPIGPVSNATLLEIHLHKARGLAKKYDQRIPLYLMTSPATHDEQVEFLAAHQNFGLRGDDLVVFCQGSMPAVDAATGQLLLEEKGALFLSPDGHGGTVAALSQSGAFEHMRARGIEHLFYFQVDNPLAPVGDAEFVGYHLLARSELTSLAIAKQTPEDKLGNFVMVDGRMQVIEYSDFPADVAAEKNPDGSLKFWAGSIAIHMFSVEFLERMQQYKEALPFHVAHKKVPYIDPTGKRIEPQEPNALKFERFIFDLLPLAERPLVVEWEEEECFAPLKNAPGAPKDTPEYVRRFMLNQHRRWLEAAGATVEDGAMVEIDPAFAVDSEEVARRVGAGDNFQGRVYLRD
jgi:UDP-N-acetylglucosamine/UDP-N-acetylgalactosamine diphosphorylase